MEIIHFRKIGVLAAGFVFLLIPALLHAQSQSTPPIGTPLVREGTFAVKLDAILDVGWTEDDVEAESKLGEVGIAPRNGWIADYPVTPDIIGELQTAVANAADSNRLSIDRDEALKRLNDISVDSGLPVNPYADGQAYEGEPPESENYPDPSAVNTYYTDEGPPVITCYAPPPDYYYLYAWIPYPFWYSGFWFPGYFILHDFHKTVHINNRVAFVSNHFNDINVHKVFRIDPVSRFHGKTYAGIGAPRSKNFISTGVPRSDRSIFQGSSGQIAPGSRVTGIPYQGGRTTSTPDKGRRVVRLPDQRGRKAVPPGKSGKIVNTPQRGSEEEGSSSEKKKGGSSSRGGGESNAKQPYR